MARTRSFAHPQIFGMKKWAPLLFQSAVSLGLLVWIFWKEDFRSQIWQVLNSAHLGWLAVGFLVAGAGNLIGVVRWAIFLRVLGISLAPWDCTSDELRRIVL